MYELCLDLILTNEYPSTSNEYCGAFCEYFNLGCREIDNSRHLGTKERHI